VQTLALLIAERATWLVPLVLSLAVHEWAHARAALALGDRTAADQGRLTLDPTAHVDPVGTFVLPLLGLPFGWARPVPIEPLRFRPEVSMAMGVLWTTLAGPASNFLLAAFSVLAYGLVVRSIGGGVVSELLASLASLNTLLGLFNLLPVHPLDGSRVVDGLCPDALRPLWDRLQGLAPLPLLGVALGGTLFGWDLFGPPMRLVHAALRWAAA
jgi:Zn-dependent protease